MAKSIFGEKVVILSEFMELQKYGELLGTMDVGIYNHDRQQSYGNIFTMLMSGAKIYMNEDSPLWEIFNEMNFMIHSVASIDQSSFADFLQIDKAEKNYNIKNAKKEFGEEKLVQAWSDIFNIAHYKK